MPSASSPVVASGAVGAGSATTPLSTGPDLVEHLAFGLELKFLLLGLPLTEGGGGGPSTPREQRLSDAHLASSESSLQQRAYSAIARAIERGAGSEIGKGKGRITRNKEDRATTTATTTTAAADDENAVSAPFSLRAISRHDVARGGRSERDYWATHWIVKKANSVEHTATDPRPDARRTLGPAVPVELSSPKLAWWMDPCAPYSVREVVSRIKTFPVITNHTCDVHVHIGRYDGASFTLPTLKKLATVFWLAEPILRSVRDPHSPNFSNAYTWGSEQRRWSRLALALERHRRLAAVAASAAGIQDHADEELPVDDVNIAEEVLLRLRQGNSGLRDKGEEDWYQYMGSTGRSAFRNEALRAIWRTESTVELGLLLSGVRREHRRLGFNFSAFGGEDERARTNPRTIEFRILDGTLQEELVLGWLQICGQLTALGMKGHQAQFRDVVRYLLAQQPAYEELQRSAGDLALGSRESHGSERVERPGWPGRSDRAARPSRHVLFGDFMDRIGVDAIAYEPFQAKILQEYGSA
ncbi:hypothetical protein SPI_07094 [Niveomyces insectorum RCEF 264]|uniref:Amidoligase enzyme n=1 Tax=Niveomyces insectorum RCEF 264 TaxID=1081102 RepID=A0A167Q9M3_9HYPO|nr:hypothetical protein SPI_07094 [Niveomyces insectorum RCEF 264]